MQDLEEEVDPSKEYTDNLDEFMNVLTPSDMLTVELAAGEELVFYMKVDYAPSKLKIAFSLTSESAVPIDFKVRSYIY